METLRALFPLMVATAGVGPVVGLLLAGGWAIGPWLLAAVLVGHGWIHVMFLLPRPQPATTTPRGLAWPFDTRDSWLIRGGMNVQMVRTVGAVLIAATASGFALAALAALGVVLPADWWATLVVLSAGLSALVLSIFFSPTLLLGVAIDVALILLALTAAWTPAAAGLA